MPTPFHRPAPHEAVPHLVAEADAAAAAAAGYVPPTLTPLGALQDMLLIKTAGQMDLTDGDPVDPRSKE